jgi:amino acid adenylation domain-containing protein
VSGGQVLGLGPAQTGIMFHSLHSQDTGSYLGQMVYEIQGDLDVGLFRRCFELLIARHEALRAGFVLSGPDEPVQYVRPAGHLDLTVADWRDYPVDGVAVRLTEFLAQDRASGFRLADGTLFRLALLRIGQRRWYFVWTYHHVILDGWSVAILWSEWLTSYDAAAAGSADPAASLGLPPRYSDYLAWIEQQDQVEARQFWEHYLIPGDCSARLDPPSPAPGAAGVLGVGEVGAVLRAGELDRLDGFARQRRLTLASILAAGWSVVLSRHTRSVAPVFGLTSSGRTAEVAGIDRLVGLVSNTTPCQARLAGQLGVAEWLGLVQEDLIDARQFDYTPLPSIKAWAGARDELFQTVLTIENYPRAAGPAPHFDVRHLRTHEQTHYLLNVQVVIAGSGLELRCGYDAERVERGYAQAAVEQFAHLLRQLPAVAGQPVDTVEILPPAMRERIVVSWNATADPAIAGSATLPELVLEQCRRTPGLVAVLDHQRVLRYAELAEESGLIASELAGLGVRAGDTVAVALPRSAALPVALLGVLRAGAAYLPLDPDAPRGYTDSIVADAGAAAIITPTGEIRREAASGGPAAGSATADAAGAAYVMYTSGSTGKPKGVIVSHRALCHRLRWMQREYQLGPQDCVLQKTPATFDVSGWELFWPLISGARLALARPDGHRDPAYLQGVVARWGVTTIHFVPSMLRGFLDELDPAGCESLRRIFASGEALPVDLSRRCLASLPGAELVNLYGPTEAAIDVCAWRCSPSDSRVPIGYPIANTQLYLLDKLLRLAPPGVPGELCIGGIQVATGYLNRPGRTAESFVPDPFGPPGARLYRTGDLARHLPDGSIEFLGRMDSQVKIRGVRIEADGVAAVCREHPQVKDAAVVARKLPSGDSQLVAYVCPAVLPAEPVTGLAGGLTDYLRKQLPDSHVPAHVVVLPALPLTSSGKLRRDALPAPEQEGRLAAGRQPSTRTELLLAGLYAEILGVQAVATDADFFELRGDSILSMRLASAARARGIWLTTRAIFDTPTISGLSRRLADPAGLARSDGPAGAGQPSAAQPSAAQPSAAQPSAAQPSAGQTTAALLPVHEWFFEQQIPDPAHRVYAVVARFPPGRFTVGQAEAALRRVVEGHDAFRTTVGGRGGARCQRISAAAEPSVECVSVSGDAELSALLASARDSFDLSRGPLSACWVRRGADRSAAGIVLLLLHRLIVDVVSFEIMLDEVTRQLRRDKAGGPPAATSALSWSEYLHRYATSAVVTGQLGYWREICAAPSAVLPRDLTGEDDFATATRVHCTMTLAQTSALLDYAKAHRATVEDLLLASLAEALAGWTGDEQWTITVGNNGRAAFFDDVDLSAAVGWFTCMYPVVLSHRPGAASAACVDTARARRLELRHAGLGFGVASYRRRDLTGEQLRLPRSAQINVNYMGREEAANPWEDVLPQLRNEILPRRGTRPFPIELHAGINEGQLDIAWRYSPFVFREATMRRVVDGQREALGRMLREW